MALVPLVAVILVPLGLVGMLAVTTWLERWLPPADRIAAARRPLDRWDEPRAPSAPVRPGAGRRAGEPADGAAAPGPA